MHSCRLYIQSVTTQRQPQTVHSVGRKTSRLTRKTYRPKWFHSEQTAGRAQKYSKSDWEKAFEHLSYDWLLYNEPNSQQYYLNIGHLVLKRKYCEQADGSSNEQLQTVLCTGFLVSASSFRTKSMVVQLSESEREKRTVLVHSLQLHSTQK